mmetsp:Transcript_43605/g.120609  ORF Transcript_43605/g.120609 Transcript_43605/m.120609 type:complete len:202 (-) Transcript_43605:872-1477(-)
MKPRTADAGDTSLTARYLSQPQRATHSRNSSKSSVAMSSVAEPCPASSWSADCESMNAILACGIEKRHLYSVRQLGSPVMSDSRKHCQMPTRSCRSHTRIHCLKPSLSVISASLVSSDVVLTYHACSLSRYSSSTAMTACSSMTVSRNMTDVSRRARGSTSSSIIVSRHSGKWTTARLLPKLPCVGLARWKEMRMSMLRNS